MTIKPVADLYLIKYEDGRLYKCTRDAEEAVDAIGFGFDAEEFVSLEKHRAAMLQGAENAESRCTIQAAPALDSSPKIAESRCGNSPVIPDGLRLALSNAGIAAPESDEMLAATCEKYIQALVDWVKDRKPFEPAKVVPDGWVACSDRLPEVGEIVLTSDGTSINLGESERSGVNLRFFTSIFSGRELPATHWMPLPAAPQQEVK